MRRGPKPAKLSEEWPQRGGLSVQHGGAGSRAFALESRFAGGEKGRTAGKRHPRAVFVWGLTETFALQYIQIDEVVMTQSLFQAWRILCWLAACRSGWRNSCTDTRPGDADVCGFQSTVEMAGSNWKCSARFSRTQADRCSFDGLKMCNHKL